MENYKYYIVPKKLEYGTILNDKNEQVEAIIDEIPDIPSDISCIGEAYNDQYIIKTKNVLNYEEIHYTDSRISDNIKISKIRG